jgi:membrane-associated phospholipid phosphatase
MTTPPARAERPPPPHEGVVATLDRVRRELGALDLAVYDAVAGTPSPTIDAALARISNAANHSRLWIVTGGVVSLFGKDQRRSVLVALAAVGLTSAVGNLAVKPALSRGRPERTESSRTQQVRMPESHSFPSGHTASAFAFSSALGAEMPSLATPLRLMATTVAYSRVHTGVHYPGDVVIGALIGAGLGTGTRLLARRLAVSGR